MILSTGSLFHVLQLEEDANRVIDFLELEWYETAKTIIRKRTLGGLDAAIRKDSASNPLLDGDVIYHDERLAIVVKILPCICLVVKPSNFKDMVAVCNEIGNRHIAMHIGDQSEIATEFEHPLYQVLNRRGYNPQKEERVLYQTHTLSMTSERALLPKIKFK
jgi:urease accessory protein